MSITPQAIKDQEFQVKFRGYDSIEVKAYLELLAEEFFELHEQLRKHEEDYQELLEENDALKQERDVLLNEGRARDERSEASEVEFREKDELIRELEDKVESSQQEKLIQQESWEKQEAELREEIEQLNAELAERSASDSATVSEAEKLRAQVDMLDNQIAELKQEELDFKATLVAAQQFAQDVKNKAQEEADRILADAHQEVEDFRIKAEAELAELPVEIKKLQERKVQVHEDLRAVLHTYLEQLDVVHAMGSDEDEDLSDLFQSIRLNDDEMENA